MAEDKGLATLKAQVTKATNVAKELEVNDEAGLIKATDLLGNIKKFLKMVNDRKDGYTRPAYTAYKEIMARAKEQYDPLIVDAMTAEQIIKEKAIAFRNAENARVEAEQAKLAKRVEAGTMKPETAAKKMELAQGNAIESKVEGKTGGMTFKKVRKLVITDKMAVIKAVAEGSLLIDAVELNMVVLRDLVVKQGEKVPGTKVEEVDEIAGTSR